MIEIGTAKDLNSLIEVLNELKEEMGNVPIYVGNQVTRKTSNPFLYNYETGLLISY